MQVCELSPSSKNSSEPVAAADDHDGAADAAARFDKSLRELRDLRSQLHRAADHCETAYLNATSKKKIMVVENTRVYICEAVVTVVDHLGNVSANLECRLLSPADVAHTEQRIDLLRQRLLTCQQYALSVELSALRWNPGLPRHLPHYVTPLARHHPEKSNGDSRDDVTESIAFEILGNQEVHGAAASASPVIRAGANARLLHRSSSTGIKLSTALPVLGGQSMLTHPCNSSFGSQAPEDARAFGFEDRKKKPVRGSYFLAFLWRNRRNM